MKSDLLASVRYLVPGGEKPIYIASRGGADAALRIGAKFEDREVTIKDARKLKPPASLDLQGFLRVSHTTQVGDFYSLEQDRSVYAAELTELVLAASGGASALMFDHTLRSDSPAIRHQHLSDKTIALRTHQRIVRQPEYAFGSSRLWQRNAKTHNK